MEPVRPRASFTAGRLAVAVYQDPTSLGRAAAEAAARWLRSRAQYDQELPVVFAAARSHIATLAALIATVNLPWKQVVAFHMDEYVGISETHPASFRRFLRDHLTEKVQLLQSHMIDGSNADTARTCREYADLLRRHPPVLCLLGIGENGHLAFNDPAVADFHDPQEVKVVELDEVCRSQQVAEGWFKTLTDVPRQAITMTLPALLRAPKLIVSVPGVRKAEIVKRTLQSPISVECPATILRTHPDATLYLDRESASRIDT